MVFGLRISAIFILVLCLTGCKTTMVTVETVEYTGGVPVCYNDYYTVPSDVADSPEKIQEHVEKWDMKPQERKVKPC